MKAPIAGFGLLLLALICWPFGLARAQAPTQPPMTLDIRQAYQFALANNPELAAVRQQRAIASGGLVVARTLPFNPLLSLNPRGVSGTQDMGVVRHWTFAGSAALEVEVNGQRRARIAGARASLSKTEWEIAYLEFSLAVRTVRAFNAVLYRKEKQTLLEDNVRLAERAVRDAGEVWKKKNEKPPAGEVVLAQFEVQEAKAQLVNGRSPLVTAQYELRRALAVPGDVATVGSLEITYRDLREEELLPLALAARADLQARHLAVTEAEAKLRLERANRFGNPSLGPNYEVNEAKASFIGATFEVPLPILNRKKGDIMQREAELTKALFETRNTEQQIQQDVRSALARLAQVQELIRVYRKDYVPALEARLLEMEKLYAQGNQGVDLQQVLELRRRLLITRQNYLDALYDHGQIEVDLAAAVGDLELAFDPP